MYHLSNQAILALQGFQIDRRYVGKRGGSDLVLDRNQRGHNLCLSTDSETDLETSLSHGHAREAAQPSACAARGILTPSCGCTSESAFKLCKSHLSNRPCNRSAGGGGGGSGSGRREDQSEVSSSRNLRSSRTTGLTQMIARRGICTTQRRRETKKYELTWSDRCKQLNTGITLECTNTLQKMYMSDDGVGHFE